MACGPGKISEISDPERYSSDMELSTKLVLGDCLNVMKALEADSIDTIITDPPYGLGFMGKMWDHGVPGIPFWEAALRVAKPGAMLLAFGGTRTSHRLTCAIEDAGWEIRDSIIWLYASGFPKSHNISKALDKAAGKKRKSTGPVVYAGGHIQNHGGGKQGYHEWKGQGVHCGSAPTTDISKTWEGWGTALAPSHEPIIMAMKPREGTFANNALARGVAGLWIDGGRIPTVSNDRFGGGGLNSSGPGFMGQSQKTYEHGTGFRDDTHKGRWPKNTIFTHHPDCVERGTRRVKGQKSHSHNRDAANQVYGDWSTFHDNDQNRHVGPDGLETVPDWDCHPECPVRMLAEQSGESGGGRFSISAGTKRDPGWAGGMHKPGHTNVGIRNHGDTGTAARFYFCAKASRRERNLGLEGKGEKVNDGRQTPIDNAYQRGETLRLNTHPTVKPLSIMRYLCKLTKTPTGGVVLDPFAGSFTTGMACIYEGRDFIGIEIDPEYLEIGRQRIAYALAACDKTDTDKSNCPHDSQLPLFQTLEKGECDERE